MTEINVGLEETRVQGANRKAWKLGRAHNLLVTEWIDTLTFFRLHCAYCGIQLVYPTSEEIEHEREHNRRWKKFTESAKENGWKFQLEKAKQLQWIYICKYSPSEMIAGHSDTKRGAQVSLYTNAIAHGYINDSGYISAQYAEYKANLITLDHYIPLTGGGGSTKKNCLCVCIKCNRNKGDKLPEELRLPTQQRQKIQEWLNK